MVEIHIKVAGASAASIASARRNILLIIFPHLSSIHSIYGENLLETVIKFSQHKYSAKLSAHLDMAVKLFTM